MTRLSMTLAVMAATGISGLATTAQAQDSQKGIYAVARLGVAIDPDQKIDNARGIGSAFDTKTKYKTGVTGEIGGGYDFGMFRIEQTVGYTETKPKNLSENGYTGDGRNKAFNMMVSGYVDIPVSRIIVPYVGGGIGVTRVDAQMSRTDTVTGVGSSYSGKDWGMMFQAAAGVGIHVAPKVVVEVGARYSQTNGLKFNGFNGTTPAAFEPKMQTLSGTVGVRYLF